MHETCPTIIASDIALPIRLELPIFTVVKKLLFPKSRLAIFLIRGLSLFTAGERAKILWGWLEKKVHWWID